VRLFTRNGYDWTKRYPWIVESALKNRQKHFVIDGEAVILGVDGISDRPSKWRWRATRWRSGSASIEYTLHVKIDR
jgi:hypothetical protein